MQVDRLRNSLSIGESHSIDAINKIWDNADLLLGFCYRRVILDPKGKSANRNYTHLCNGRVNIEKNTTSDAIV